MSVHQSFAMRVEQLGLQLPEVVPGNNPFVATRRVGNLLFVSGQGSKRDGQALFIGKVGVHIDLSQAREAARLCTLNVLAHVAQAVQGDLAQVKGCVQLRGYVNAVDDFTESGAVIDAASQLLVQVLGERGQHTRTTIGVSSLPRGFAVEVDAVFELA
ncbi:RidA family protein [Pseudomonas sp. 39004]|jgi:enamine deaminase RidA (YjgF/YER057c/UK114 family)|uniref:RidA family protein n=1 Tax=Pseudomonas TaxID=286 RepID=UPI002363B98A|nr:RidA family protein [Pseudomonas sp. 39004]MDD1963603.1 RidA family protein [Pseudomonas sp. 39004]